MVKHLPDLSGNLQTLSSYQGLCEHTRHWQILVMDHLPIQAARGQEDQTGTSKADLQKVVSY